MARLSEKTKETLTSLLIIAVGLLLSSAVLMFLYTKVVGGPIALFGIIMGMMGQH